MENICINTKAYFVSGNKFIGLHKVFLAIV